MATPWWCGRAGTPARSARTPRTSPPRRSAKTWGAIRPPINKSNIDNQTRGIDQGEIDTYAEEGVPEEVERHPRADEEEEGDLSGPRRGRRSGGRDAQERLGAEQRHEEEQEGERRGEADAEAGPRAAAGRRERRHGRRPLHRHLRGRMYGGGLLLALAGLRGIQN